MTENTKKIILKLNYKCILSGNEISIYMKQLSNYYQVIVGIQNENNNIIVDNDNIISLKKRIASMSEFIEGYPIKYFFLISHINRRDKIHNLGDENIISYDSIGNTQYKWKDSCFEMELEQFKIVRTMEDSIRKQMQIRKKKKCSGHVIVTPVLSLLLCVIFIRRSAYESYALSWKAIENRNYINLIAYSIFHINISHLLGNVISLSVLGTMLEKRIGTFRYFILIIMSSIYTGLASAFVGKIINNEIPTIGISGVVYAVMAALLLYLKKNKENYIWLIWLMFSAFFKGIINPNVDNIVHLTGIIFGFIFICLYWAKIQENIQKINIRALNSIKNFYSIEKYN